MNKIVLSSTDLAGIAEFNPTKPVQAVMNHFVPVPIDALLAGMNDAKTGEDHAGATALKHGGGAAAVVALGVGSAAASGAGALAGYAG